MTVTVHSMVKWYYYKLTHQIITVINVILIILVWTRIHVE